MTSCGKAEEFRRRSQSRPIHAVVDDRIVVAALGDSITEGSPGYDACRGGDETSQWEYWAARIEPRLVFRNCGIYGQRTDEIVARLDVGWRPSVCRRLPPAWRSRRQAGRLQLVDVAVGCALDAVGQRKLFGAMDDDEPACAGFLEGGDCLFRRQVTAQAVGATFAAFPERRFAEEEVRVTSNLCQLRARRRVAGVG